MKLKLEWGLFMGVLLRKKNFYTMGSSISKFFSDQLEASKKNNISVVIGNESCDADSFISSLALAINFNYIPLINISKKTFSVKGDMQFILKIIGVKIDDLFFMEDEKILISEKNIKIILSDHNYFNCGNNKNWEIISIYDHHEIISDIPYMVNKYIDCSVGSVCSIVSKEIFENLDKKYKKILAYLLLLVIVSDTNHLKYNASSIDKKEYEILSNYLKISINKIEDLRNKFEETKRNEEFLSTEEILLKDYKEYNLIGISAVEYNLKRWIDRSNGEFINELMRIKENKKLDIFIIGIIDNNKRYMVSFGLPENKLKEIKINEYEYKGVKYIEYNIKWRRKYLLSYLFN